MSEQGTGEISKVGLKEKLRRVGSKIGEILSPAPDDTRIGGDVAVSREDDFQPGEEKEPEIPEAKKEGDGASQK